MAVCLAALAMLGCNQGGSSGTVPVSGVITLDGTPVEGATVSFAPTGGEGVAAAGMTDAKGRYELTTQEPGDGAMPGKYMVMISKVQTAPDPGAEAVKPGMSPEEATEAVMKARDAAGLTGEEGPAVTDLLPAKYKNPSQSGFTVEVAPGKGEFNFDLKSDAKPEPAQE